MYSPFMLYFCSDSLNLSHSVSMTTKIPVHLSLEHRLCLSVYPISLSSFIFPVYAPEINRTGILPCISKGGPRTKNQPFQGKVIIEDI